MSTMIIQSIVTRLLRRRKLVLIGLVSAVSAAATVSVAAATGVAHKNPRLANRSHNGIKLLSHSGHNARAAAVAALPGATGAILAATQGENATYAWRMSPTQAREHGVEVPGEATICLFYQRSQKTVGGACGGASDVEEQGLIVLHRTYNKDGRVVRLFVGALVPNGVEVVKVTDSNGESRNVSVQSNAMMVEDLSLSSVSYVLPDGKSEEVTVPPVPNPSEAAIGG